MFTPFHVCLGERQMARKIEDLAIKDTYGMDIARLKENHPVQEGIVELTQRMGLPSIDR